MAETLSSCVVGIKNRNNAIIGTGFVITDNAIATCAHVLYYGVFGEHRPIMNKDEVTITFSPLGIDYCTIVEYYHNDNDIAILKATESLPQEMNPVILCSPADVKKPVTFLTHGYRSFGEKYEGIPADGRVLNSFSKVLKRPPSYPPLLLDTKRIEGGMSGAPLYIPDVDRVIGFITLKWENEIDSAIALPAEIIREACSEVCFQPPDTVKKISEGRKSGINFGHGNVFQGVKIKNISGRDIIKGHIPSSQDDEGASGINFGSHVTFNDVEIDNMTGRDIEI